MHCPASHVQRAGTKLDALHDFPKRPVPQNGLVRLNHGTGRALPPSSIKTKKANSLVHFHESLQRRNPNDNTLFTGKYSGLKK